MTIRAFSLSPPPAKRQKIDSFICTRPTSDFKNGLMLAPMVRSGSRACASRDHRHQRLKDLERSSYSALCLEAWCKACLGARNSG